MIIFNYAVILFIILSLAGVSGMFAERSGTVNIGINGMMLFGMIGYFLFSKVINGYPQYQIILTIISGLMGMLGGFIFGFISINLKANQIIGGTAINLISAAIGAFILAKISNDQRSLKDLSWSLSNDMKSFKAIISFSLIFGIIILAVAYCAITFTPWGLRLKAAGENPQALDSQGVNVIKMRYQGIIISGFLAGIAGGLLMALYPTFSGNVKGLGFVGLAILISGQWRFQFIILSAIVFAGIYSVAENIVVIKTSLSKIQPLIQTLPFVLSLVVLAAFSKNSNAPASSGVAYDKSKR